MRYFNFLILIIFVSLFSENAISQDTRYRVELLVLTHLYHDEEPRETHRLTDYSQALDFLSPVEPEEDMGGQDEPEVLEMLPGEDPNRVLHIEEMGDEMSEAWRRLRASGPFRPEQYLSWEQGDQEPFPVLRIHSPDVVMTDDPRTDPRTQSDGPSEKTVVFADDAGLNALSKDPEAGLPDPALYFRLDGSASLTRSRFLHLALDIQHREPILKALRPAGSVSGLMENKFPTANLYRVYELKQRRQVRTGRMEYFDSPVLGVLAFITSIEQESGESQ
jgi:hypothetical protein